MVADTLARVGQETQAQDWRSQATPPSLLAQLNTAGTSRRPVASRPAPVLDGAGRPVWVGVPGQPQLGQVVLYRDEDGNFYAHTGGPHSHNYPVRTREQGTAIARIRDWLTQPAPPLRGIYGRTSNRSSRSNRTSPTSRNTPAVPVRPTAMQVPYTYSNPGTPAGGANGAGWFFENLMVPEQIIVPVWRGPNDYIVRLVFDKQAAATQPASINLKTTVLGLDTAAGKARPLNFTVRHESSSWKVSTGSKLQFGYDVTRDPAARQRPYIEAGEPVLDLISIETKADAVVNRVRSELAMRRGEGLNVLALAQHAVSTGGFVRWRRVWVDRRTGERRGIDVILGGKAEGILETGYGAKPNAMHGKADLELTVRYMGAAAGTVDVHELTQRASTALADLLVREPRLQSLITPYNHGDRDVARLRATTHLQFGASIWQLARGDVSGGLNHGHAGLALGIRVNELLHQTGMLPRGQWVQSHQQAQALLNRLFAAGGASQRAQWAARLANRLQVNFGFSEVARLNEQLLAQGTLSTRERGYRAQFLAHDNR